ncbi:MAG: TolC family protein [Gammaproteobacteria bacterium]|nr:TolC family protein [Gammaproteobacteria bacterium]
MYHLNRFSQRLSLSLIVALPLSFGLVASQAMAASSEYIQLLEPIQQHQPEQMTAQAIETLQAANQSLSSSWLAGDLSLNIHHENDALTGAESAQTWALGAEFPVWLPSQKAALEGLSNGYQSQLRAQSGYLSWLASSTLRGLAWEAKKATIEVDLAASALEQSQALAERVQQKVNVGESTQLDLLLAQKSVLQQQTNLVQKQGQLQRLQSQFTAWTGYEGLPADIDETALAPISLTAHPQIVWLSSFLEVAQAELAQQKQQKQAAPTLYVGAQNDRSTGFDNTSLVFEISIPLGVGASNNMAVAEKQVAITEKRAALKQAKFELKRAIIEATQQVATQKKQGDLIQQQSVLDNKALALAEKSYQYGASTLQDLLRIQQQALASQLTLELSNATLGQSIAQLNQMMGYSLDSTALNQAQKSLNSASGKGQ